MSTPFYDLASLVLVPSGYKAQKVYAQKPLTTDGQLTFSRASTATRVNSAGLIETVSSNVPRLDYQGSTCPKILLEPQRSNISGFVESGTGNYSTATVTAGTSILGLTTFRVTSNYALGDAPHIANASEYQNGVTYTASAYVNLAQTNATNIEIAMFGFGSPNGSAAASLNVSTKAVTTTATSGAWSAQSGKATLISGSIYRLEIKATAAQTLSGSRLYCAAAADAKYCEVAGIQIEAGAYATSFTGKSTTAAVTRLADACSKTGISSLIGQTEGTIFVEGTIVANDSGTNRRLISISDNTSSNQIQIFNRLNTSKLECDGNVSGVTQFSFQSNNIGFNTTFKAAIAYKGNDIAFYVNGTLIGTDTSASIPATSRLAFSRGDLLFPHEGNINQALLFKTRLPNAQLAELTSL